eukprot:SAG31_NODE_10887_length_1087_cov_1.003036_2_plen_84_part_00
MSHQICEDELIPRAVELRQYIQSLGVATQATVGNLDIEADYAVVTDVQVRLALPVRPPNYPKVGNRKLASFTIVAFRVLYGIH